MSYRKSGSTLRYVAAVFDSAVASRSVKADGHSAHSINKSSESIEVDFYEVLESDIEMLFNGFY